MNIQPQTDKATAGPDAYGFIHTLDGCVFAYGCHMADLTIQPPAGFKIGLNMGDKLRTAFNEYDALKAVAEAAAILMKQNMHGIDLPQSVSNSAMVLSAKLSALSAIRAK